jgi:hypothetical protein
MEAVTSQYQGVAEQTGFSGRNYFSNVFIDFGYTEDSRVCFPQVPQIDSRRHPKEMVFGLSRGGSSIAFMYDDLEPTGVVNRRFDGEHITVFYEPQGRLAQGYRRRVDDQLLHFSRAGSTPETTTLSLFVDAETGSTWNLKGEAVTGPLTGKRLTPIGAYSSYWFAWASFWPETGIWDGSNSVPPTAVETVGWGQIKSSTPGLTPTTESTNP